RFLVMQFIRPAGWLLAAIAAGVVIGSWAGHENWVLLGAIAVFPFVLRWPAEMAFGMFALVVPFDAIAVAGQASSGVTLSRVIGAAAAFVLLLAGLAGGRLHTPPRAALWWSLFFVWCGATCAWSLDPNTSLTRIPTAVALLLIYVVSVSFQFTPTERHRVILLTILGGCCAAAYVMAEFYRGVSIAGTQRASLVIGSQEADPNGMAAGLLLPTSLAVGLFFSSQKRIAKILAMLAIAGIGFSIFLTMSRGAALALVMMAAIFLLRLKSMRALAPLL